LILNRESIKQIISVLATSEKRTVTEDALFCSRYTIKDYEHYLDGQMATERIQPFESHCENCLSCLEKLYLLDVELSPEQEKTENEQLFLKTKDLLNQLDQKNDMTLLEIIIKVADKAIELISTTGLPLQGLQPVTVRSTEGAEQTTTSPIRIMQEAKDSPYSLQATIQSDSDSIITLSMSIFNHMNEEFAESINTILKTPTTKKSQLSDRNGEVTFQITESGTHELTLTTSKDVIGKILLTMT